MKMPKYLLSSLFFLVGAFVGYTQELNCEVKVTTENVNITDPSVFREMERKVFEFMNNTQWTSDHFEPQERIDCSIYINILSEAGPDEFNAAATIKSSRPVYNSAYNSVLLDVYDKDFTFHFDPFSTLQYRENEFADNLTANLTFYAYTILALDYDSFSRLGGTSYHQKALQIINSASAAPYPGWTSNTTNNRGNLSKYWINENLTNPKYLAFRNAIYNYHRNGLDRMYENPTSGWDSMQRALNMLKTLNNQTRSLPFMGVFFNAKKDEIVGAFSKAPPSIKTDVVNIATEIDPINTKAYRRLLK